MMLSVKFRPKTNRMTVDERAKLNGGFAAGPHNMASNRRIEERMMSDEMGGDKNMPPNLHDVGSDAEMCGNCQHYAEGEGCEKYQYPCKFSDVCDDYSPMGMAEGEEAPESPNPETREDEKE